MNTAEYLVKNLEDLGISDFFGLPGDYNFDILYAIENNPNTNWIGCTNELNAGYAADGYARKRGFGALVTTYGVGELSAMNAIAGCFAENIPVIHIVGVPTSKNISEKKLIHHNFQNPNPQAYENAFKNVCETTAFLNRDNAKIEIDRVLKIFIKERKPVYIAIPMDVASMEISTKTVDYNWISNTENLEKVVAEIIKKVNNSKKPVILGDSLVKRFDAKSEYKKFVEESKIPTTNFLMGSCLINADLPNYIGGYFGKYKNPLAYKMVQETDCLIAVGVIYSDLNSFGLDLPYKINSQIAIYGTYTYVEGIKYDNVKMSDVLNKLSLELSSRELNLTKTELGYLKINPTQKVLTSEYIYPRLQEFLKEKDILFAETGIIPHGVCQIKFPNDTELHTQTLWGSIGWATPAAFGTSIADPNSRVILFTGEGSHQLTAMELGSMLRYGVKPIILVLNNSGYTIERMLSNDAEDNFNQIMKMNYSKFARAFEGDIWATKVQTEDEFDKALRVTQIINKLCYIEICTDKMDAPELSKKVIGDFKLNTKKERQNAPKETVLVDTEIELKKDKNLSFETIVHTSLKDIGD